MAKIAEINVKPEKGKPSSVVDKAVLIEGYGFKDDVHGGRKGRELSLMGMKDKEAVKSSKGFCKKFVENVTIEGIEMQSLSVGTRFRMGEAVIEISSVGKECYADCPAYEGDTCGLANRIAFARVVKGGEIRLGDAIK